MPKFLARLTWLTYLIGAAIAGRMAFASNSEQDHDEADGDLICRVVQLMQYTDRALPGRGLEKLEYAYLWFLEQFRKIYLTDHMQKISKVSDSISFAFERSVFF